MYDLTEKEKVAKLLILISGKKDSQLLTVVKISSSKGEAQITAVFETIQDWETADIILTMCIDSNCSNTGYNSGACFLI